MASPSEPSSEARDDATQKDTKATTGEPNRSICGVCNDAPSKYKCPRCYLPYCSVACNKVHRENHPPDEPKPTPTETATPTQAGPPATTSTAATAPDNNPKNPFRALDSASDKFQMLFTKYPSLPQQLMEIHAAMQPPQETPQNNGIPASLLKGLPNKKDNWNHDVGIKNGKEALRKARRADGSDGEAVREYCELIAYLMSGQGGPDATGLLQRQAAMQDTELIERLMAEEKRR